MTARRFHLLDSVPPENPIVGDLFEYQCKHGRTGINELVRSDEKVAAFKLIRHHGCIECTGYAHGYAAAVNEAKARSGS